jgi:D-arabinose 1-dehydrogenase-like Zn-dependent alcohol dehydrogenase
MTMVRAAVTEKPGSIALREFAMPDPGPGAVVMKVQFSGICGTDKHTFRGESKQYAGTPHERDLTYPLICGHENVGDPVAVLTEIMSVTHGVETAQSLLDADWASMSAAGAIGATLIVIFAHQALRRLVRGLTLGAVK